MKVIIEAMPENLDMFKSMPAMDLSRPENTCAMFLCALHLFTKDQKMGTEAINVLKGPAALSPFDVQFIRDRLMDKPYLPVAYFDGATPENNYEPEKPYTLTLHADGRPQDIEEGYMRLYVATAGADSKRAITLRQKDNNWYLWDYPGFLADIRKPQKEDPWA